MIRKRSSISSGAGPPPLRKCSNASIVSLVTNTSIIDNDDYSQKEDCSKNERGQQSLLWMLHFDALCLKSTSLRNTKMLSSTSTSLSYTTVTQFGVDVLLTDQYHYNASELEPYRLIGDPEMDSLLDTGCVGPYDDLVLSASAAAACKDPTIDAHSQQLAQFYRHYETVPAWVDFDQIQRGINVFLAYLPAAGCSLYYRSLVGGFSIPKIVKVLEATKYLISDRRKVMTRLIDTGGFLACCFAPTSGLPAEALRPGGAGWSAALRVRVLHGKIRQRLLLSKQWDIERYGIPINQEDMAATLLAFSVNVLLGIEIIAGKPLPEQEQRDYLALWRYIGWLLGVDTPESESNSSNRDATVQPMDPCGPKKHDELCDEDSILHSYASLESIILHILHPEPSSCDFVKHLLSVSGSFAFRAEFCRRLLGHPLADALGLPSLGSGGAWDFVASLALAIVVYIVLMYFRIYTLLTMSYPWLNKKAIKFHGSLQRSFLVKWEEGHSSRMSAAYKKDKSQSGRDSKKMSSACPFSMVMPPKTEKCNSCKI